VRRIGLPESVKDEDQHVAEALLEEHHPAKLEMSVIPDVRMPG
jgi:hypothetical protein